MKRKRPEIADATTDDRGALAEGPLDANVHSRAAADGPPGGPAIAHSESRLEGYVELLRSCAERLLCGGPAEIGEILAQAMPALSLDAFAAFVATNGDRALTLEASAGISNTALSTATIGAIATDLARAGRRTLVLESLTRSTDSRAAPFRELGFASVVVAALVDQGSLLGAVVLAARSKAHFSSVELAVIDTLVCYLRSAHERRELTRHRHDAEHRKREFLTVLAHELRNPLAPVRNALEIIRANDRTRSPVEHSAYAMIERQLRQIGRLADDLLDANQVVLGHVELSKQRVLLDTVLERAAEQSRPWIEAARQTLVLDLPREAIALDADPKRLARALSNLINDAARRMDRGGRIVISAEAADGTVAVLVRARGRGVSDEALSELFVDSVAESEVADGQSHGGVTAGMTLVKHLVEMHGGAVSARRIAGDGAEFAVRLPMVHAPSSTRLPAQPPVEDHAALTVPHRILIADDNADSAESMGMLLRLMGNDVRIASDGLDAVEQAASFQPDIVLMDIGMPRLDGYEAARRIRDQDWSRDTLLVAVTGWGPSDNSEEATAAGFDHHFTKPLDPAELRRLVSAARPH